MTRKTIRMLLVALVAVLSLGSIAEAAAGKPVHHRTRRSSRTVSGATQSQQKKTKKVTTAARRKTRKPTANRPKTTVKRTPSTKPR